MAHIIADRVRETTTTTGTSAFALSAVTGFRRLADVCAVNDTVPYVAEDGTDWEVGIGTYSATNTLTRTTILASSNAGAVVSFSAGTKRVFVAVPASAFVPAFRPRVSGVSLYDIPGVTIYEQSTATRLGNRLYYEPLIVGPEGLYVAEVAVQVSSAAPSGNTLRLGICSIGSDNYPDEVLWGTVGLAIDATGIVTAAPALFLSPGRYYKMLWPTWDVGMHTWRGTGGAVRSALGGGWDIAFRYYVYRDTDNYDWTDPLPLPDSIDNDSGGFEHCIVLAS